ncbi:MAG: hypothetical protein Q7J64_06360, partial [Elusimicrobiota bacterium]|nr:hypothetical protein [Elusimicrobiota bacterium]
MRPPSLISALGLVFMLAAHAGAAVVEVAFSPALWHAARVPAFRESMMSQIQLTTSLSAQPAPTLTPLLTATPSSADPWRAESGRIVAALVTQPQDLAATQAQLRAAIGDHGVDLLLKASARLHASAETRPELRAQMDGVRRILDLDNPQYGTELSGRLNSIFENSTIRATAENLPVADTGGPAKKPLVTLGRAGESPAMTAQELEDYVHKNAVTSPRGLKRVNFATGDYKPSYDAALRALGVEMVVIKAPSRAELGKLKEEDGYHLKSEYVRWVTTAHTLEEHDAMQPHRRNMKSFHSMLKASENIPVKIELLTQEKFDQWYPLYESEVVNKPGGKRNVARDFVSKQRAEGTLGERWGAFYYDPKDPTRMIGGVLFRAWAEKGMLVGNFAAYSPELKDASPSVRTFATGLKLARQLGLPVFSLGQDTNFYGYDYNIGLMANKASLLVTPYPSEDIVLMKIL